MSTTGHHGIDVAIHDPHSQDDEFNAGLLYRPIHDRSMSRDRCFLCGKQAKGANRTAEHVFPQWLLRQYGLAQKRLTLLNGESIEYGRLKIVCCPECNNIWLSRVEEKVKTAFERGVPGVNSLDRQVLFSWLAKIFYGILFKELSILFNQDDPTSGNIMPQKYFEEFDMLHQLLQSIRFETEFVGAPPWSIFIVDCHVRNDLEKDFDFFDSLGGLCLAIRIGPVGILACLEDNSSLQIAERRLYEKFEGHKFHWIQFKELFARVVYLQKLLNRVPKYLVKLPDHKNPTLQIVSLPMQGLSTKPVYDDWNHADFAEAMAFCMHLPFEELFQAPDLVMTWFLDESGNIREMGPDDPI